MLRLVVVGWLVSQRGVQPDGVVEAHDVVRDVRLGLGMVCIVAQPDTLLLQAREEFLHNSVVPAVALAAHAAHQAMALQQPHVQLAGVPAASVRMNQQSWPGAAA